jgi:hypothetical protein
MSEDKRTLGERIAVIEERTKDIPVIREKLESLRIQVAGTAATVAIIVTLIMKALM